LRNVASCWLYLKEYSVRTSGSYTGIAEGSGVLGCNPISMGNWFPVFGRTVVPRILDWLNLVDDGDTLLRDDGNHLPIDTVSGLNLQVTTKFQRAEHSTCCTP